ncbi:sodium ion-translocating decarboxylase subunit beta [Magnetospira sp. QH-2]|uniref:sodium ion-translocating decarboxylase subunit beta n=1 Tax=Magnetospira sp. (strain QH-2) TaxID=1288970 RepID=UPI0003E81A65|nr:sodium ion-translocating decarboxylase subunit beta [Magnetospira sp. QH-2]CCQ74031.1 Na(+)-transporting methylmalonyl-CoA/oxaloacetate decarboxylase, beta subunit [Magnetospira sp. QH-2]
MDIDLLSVFQGLDTLLSSEPTILFGRLFLIALGLTLVYLGRKGVLEALLMIPMGLGMAVVNASVLFLADGSQGTLFLDPLVDDPQKLMTILQINWLQPVYTFTFANGLIACLVFMGIGVLLDVGFVMARPFTSMFLALCAELGTVVVLPLAVWWGLSLPDAAATATIGGADGPMILFTALILSEDLFVPITVVAYLYLGLTYGGYPLLIKLMVPRHIRGLKMPEEKVREIKSSEKLVFAVVTCVLLCFLFPVAAPLFFSLFIGVVIRESGLTHFAETFAGPILYGSTFFLGLLLGVLCEASTILNPQVLILLVLGIIALTVSGIGGILGGYVLYFATGKKFNPVIGIAGVSCVPTTAKVAQKTVAAVTPDAVVLPHALGASISGVITSAIFAGILISVVR